MAEASVCPVRGIIDKVAGSLPQQRHLLGDDSLVVNRPNLCRRASPGASGRSSPSRPAAPGLSAKCFPQKPTWKSKAKYHELAAQAAEPAKVPDERSPESPQTGRRRTPDHRCRPTMGTRWDGATGRWSEEKTCANFRCFEITPRQSGEFCETGDGDARIHLDSGVALMNNALFAFHAAGSTSQFFFFLLIDLNFL